MPGVARARRVGGIQATVRDERGGDDALPGEVRVRTARAAHGVSVNPHDRSVFATCGADGSLRVYGQYRARRTLSMEPCDGALFCVQ